MIESPIFGDDGWTMGGSPDVAHRVSAICAAPGRSVYRGWGEQGRRVAVSLLFWSRVVQMAREPVCRGVDEDGTCGRAGSVDSRREQFEAFCRRVEPRLRRAYIGWCGADQAADATAEALAWAWEHLHELDELGNVVGYLYRVGQTRIRSRRQGLMPVAPPANPPHVEPGLVAAVRALPDRQRTAIWLCVACGFTHAEAASAMEITRTAMGTHVQRGMTSLRASLGVELPEGARRW